MCNCVKRLAEKIKTDIMVYVRQPNKDMDDVYKTDTRALKL